MTCATCGHYLPKRTADGEVERYNGGCGVMGYSYISVHCTCAYWTRQKRKYNRREEEEEL